MTKHLTTPASRQPPPEGERAKPAARQRAEQTYRLFRKPSAPSLRRTGKRTGITDTGGTSTAAPHHARTRAAKKRMEKGAAGGRFPSGNLPHDSPRLPPFPSTGRQHAASRGRRLLRNFPYTEGHGEAVGGPPHAVFQRTMIQAFMKAEKLCAGAQDVVRSNAFSRAVYRITHTALWRTAKRRKR